MFWIQLQRSIVKILSHTALFLFAGQLLLHAQSFNTANISTALYKDLGDNATAPQKLFHVIVSLKDQIDLSRWQEAELRNTLSKDQKVASLINTLQNKANATQPRLIDWMTATPGVDKNSIKPYWIANIIEFKANAEFIARMSNHPEIDWIEYYPEMAIENYKKTPVSPLFKPGGVEPGLDIINARALWRLGYTGYGRKVLVVDSGQEYDHPALRTQFAYNYGSLASTYRSSIVGDLCGEHGTAVAAAVLGLDRLNRDTIGPAFNALWMGGPAAFRDPGTGEICPLEGISTSTLEILQ